MRFSSENWHNTDNINSNFSTLLPRTTKLGRNKSIYNFVTFYNKNFLRLFEFHYQCDTQI